MRISVKELLALRETKPSPFLMMPSPDGGYRHPPWRIHLRADAEDVAAALHARYGDFVLLGVGALPYPPGAHDPRAVRTDSLAGRIQLDPDELRCALDGPLSVRSGATVSHGLLVTNLGEQTVRVNTDGDLRAEIVDSVTAAVVGGYAEPHVQPLITFTARPAETIRVPLLVGTASYTVRLGYRVPAGDWQLVVPLDLDDGRHLVTPPMQLTITD